MDDRCLHWSALWAAVVVMLGAGAAGAFSPARQFPDTTDGIYVYVDQLPSMNTAQQQFAASHYVGTQKQVSAQIDAIRAYNPDFLHIQYRLGVRQSGHAQNYIHNNTWSNDWATINPNEGWFLHDSQGNRVYQLYAGWLEEYCMDISGLIDHDPGGDPAYGWKEYWSDSVISDCLASHADGVFADSTHLPYAVPSDLWDSPIGSPPHTPYIPHMEIFYDYTYQRFDQADMYFIPNIGGLITTIDTTNGYYEDVHGAMVEGFGTKWSPDDWRLQQNRILRLLGNDKIYIAQNGPASGSDIAGRKWYMSNFLLLKHHKSFVNILGAGSQLHWWPEYDLDVGAPVDTTVANAIDELRSPSGIYVRQYESGLALVNPTTVSRNYPLDPGTEYHLVTPWGGGEVGSDGTAPSGGLNYTPISGSVTLDAWSGALLIIGEPPPPPPPPLVNDHVKYTYKYLGNGLYGVTFVVDAEDGQQAMYSAQMTFEGTDGGQVQQMQADLGGGGFDVDMQAVAEALHGLGSPPYDQDRDSYLLNPFAENIVDVVQAENLYDLDAHTGIGSTLQEAPLAYIVTTGDVHFHGVVGRLGENNDVNWTAEMPIPGDANTDETVDLLDLTIVANNWQQAVSGWGQADFNGDGLVDLLDLTIVSNFWDAGGGAVPEPATAALIALGGLALLRRRRR